ncbi:alpha-2-macroglobulin family protein [Noviluteimonas gilva]|uniref:Alpha-2-macroglobulin n=1 Tax=Noviluteimonas gilva TaxID=2682097 RepID=A0A7C9M1Q0_9GAMM|nr:MG2 domain-containing protein [Lysobacter gilvus]MUV13286.1 hypothetical protein [Lysobacter gilvus]
MQRWGWSVLALCLAGTAMAEEPIEVKLTSGNNITFRFPEAMQTLSTQEGTPAARFVPALKVTGCNWTNDTALTCRLAEAPPRATTFSATLPPKLRTVSGAPLPAGPLTFETERPLLFVTHEWKAGRLSFVVRAWKNSPQASIASALRMTVDGKPVPVTLRKLDSSEGGYGFDVPDVATESTLELSIVPGLASSEGPLRGAQNQIVLRATIGEPFQVRGAVCAGGNAPVIAPVKDGRIDLAGCVPGEQVRVMFSRALDKAALEAWRATWPADLRRLEDSTETHYRSYSSKDSPPERAPATSISFSVDAMLAKRTVAIPALPSKEGGLKLAPVELHVQTTAPRPSFSAPFERALLERGGDPNLQSINAPPIKVETFALGREAVRGTTKTPRSPDTGTRVRLPDVRRALDEGGYATIRTEHEGVEIARLGQLEVAAPDFDVHASAGQRSVAAWVNAWEGDAPIADAEATLLFDDGVSAGPRVVATGRTDAQGLVLLRLSDTFVLPKTKDADRKADRQWFVRVERGRGRDAQGAVLPLPMSRWGGALGEETKTELWGVADRPLYRAGETIHWTVWTRKDNGARYVAPGAAQTQTLRLSQQWRGSTLVSWQSTFDEQGRATGETRIPIHVRDGEYCIGTEDDEAVCFHVGTFRPQDLWARVSSQQQQVRPGDTLAFDIESGFYSGGSGAQIEIANIEAQLQAASPGEAWPQWREYAFNKGEDDFESIEDVDEITARTDAKGRAALKLPIDARFKDVDIPFGLLLVSAEARPADRESTTTNLLKVRYAAHARYVGLKADMEDPYGGTGAVKLTGIVIDSNGREITGQRVDVDVAFATFDEDEDVELVHSCALTSGVATDCTFPREKSGLYYFLARSGDAAPAKLERSVWVSGAGRGADESAELEMTLLDEETVTAGAPMRFEVHAPQVPARALVRVSRGADVIDQRVVMLHSTSQIVEIPTQASWPHRLQVTMLVRLTDAPPPAVALPAGFRQPIAVDSESEYVELKQSVAASPVSVAFERAQAAPSETVRLTLRNDRATPRGVTLAVTDDALRALGAEWLRPMDPAHAGFREAVPYGYASQAGFDGWNGARLRWVLARRAKNASCIDVPLEDCVITVVGAGAINPIDVSSVESSTVMTAEQIASIPVSRDVTNVALLAPGTVRERGGELSSVSVDGYAAPAPAPSFGNEFGRTGRQPPSNQIDPDAPRAPRPDRTKPADYGASLARIRTDFAETALWRSDIVLAPGESKTIEVIVPDNLTRWRAVAWSHDDADDFAMADATLEAGLPVEARLQTPVRIYPGDSTRLALNVRQIAGHASKAEARISLVQDALESQQATTLKLPANGQASFGLSIAPNTVGTALVTGAAATPDGRDAVAAPIEIASTSILATRTQAGWVGTSPMSLELPTLPHGAHQAHVDVSVWRGASALVDGWTEDMRVYPHRCWEQILSRAVAAALAIERKDPSWPEAKAVVQEALDNAGAFQTDSGGMRYFNGAANFDDDAYDDDYVPLTAYTVDALALLRSLGYAFDEDVETRAREFLEEANWDNKAKPDKRNARAIAAGTVDLEPDLMQRVADEFDEVALPAQVAAARALARTEAPEAAGAFKTLLDLAPQRGEVRSLRRGTRFDRWMSSAMREQCELIRLLEDYPRFAPEGARRSLIAGLTDLYSGGVADVDTQTAASCLRALRTEGTSGAAERIVVDATLGAKTGRLAVEAGEKRAAQRFEMAQGELAIAPVEHPDAPVAFLARVEYQEDARQAQPSAMGFSITRRYDVKRGTEWVPLGKGALRSDDWVRITLTIDNADARYFVAVTDDLPGGLRPVDMELKGVSGAAGTRDGNGSYAFDERKLDSRKPKFYAQRLPIGRHEIQYYARVGNAGEYLAAPAVVELMYGEASRARTAADRIRIANPKSPPAP